MIRKDCEAQGVRETYLKEATSLTPQNMTRCWAERFKSGSPEEGRQEIRKNSTCRPSARSTEGEIPMLWTITFLLIVLWLLGMISNYTMGGFIHVLLVIAIAAVLIRLIQGRRPV
jgi:hypothetical protein